MNKKIIALAALALAGNESQAAPYDGFYVGALGGMTLRNIDFTLTPSSGLSTLIDKYEKSYTKSGFLFGIMGGWGRTFSDSIYAGGELSVHYDTANEKRKHSINLKPSSLATLTFDSKYKKGPVLGLAARLGVVLNKTTLIYVKPGIQISKDTLEIKNPKLTAVGLPFNLDGNSSKSSWKMKLVPALGVEHAFTQNVSARLEYQYAFGLSGIKDKDSEEETKMSYKSHSFVAGISYHF
jgi:opacity protein-like surface antigen